MRRFALLVCVVATAALAGERWLGNTFANDGGSANNQYTSPPTNTFGVGSGSLISVQCDQDAFVMVNVPMVDAGTAIKLTAGQLLPTSCASQPPGYTLRDAGVYTGCLLANSSANFSADGGFAQCHWFSRQGNE